MLISAMYLGILFITSVLYRVAMKFRYVYLRWWEALADVFMVWIFFMISTLIVKQVTVFGIVCYYGL